MPENGVVVRRAQAKDIERVGALILERAVPDGSPAEGLRATQRERRGVGPQTAETANAYARERIMDRNGRAWVAEHNGQVTGFVATEMRALPGIEGNVFYARGLVVRRGSFVGEHLMKRVAMDAANRGFAHVHLQTNPLLGKFYARMGAEFLGPGEKEGIGIYRIPIPKNLARP